MKTVKDKRILVGADFAGFPLKEAVVEYLEKKGIFICAYVSSVGEINAKSYKDEEISIETLLNARGKDFPSLTKHIS